MNEVWLKPALLGVDRPQVIAMEGELGEILQRVAEGEDPALAFSRQLGAIEACRLAALRFAPTAEPPLPAAGDARLLPATDPVVGVLQQLFTGAQPPAWKQRLRHEACQLLAERQQHLPLAVLPLALEAGAQSAALRPALGAVLGERGHWLARLNPDWAYAGGGAVVEQTLEQVDQVWDEGSTEQRLQVFGLLRRRDPDAARQRLQGMLKELPAAARARFVALLQVQLSEGDAVLLEMLLKDRSREVRMLVGPMLARLPATTHAQYVQAQMRALLQRRRVLLRTSWQLEVPAVADPGWAAAAIEVRRPAGESLGERAWWLFQIARQLPLQWWCGTLDKTPEQVVVWAQTTDWSQALLRAWREQVDGQQPEWVAALLHKGSADAHMAGLLAMLPQAQREQFWPDSVDALVSRHLLDVVLGSIPQGKWLSLSLSRSWAAGVIAQLCRDDPRGLAWYQRDAWLELLAMLHPQALTGLRIPDPPADAARGMHESVCQARLVQELRRQLHTSS